ncbi:hypothetical protein Flavo103_44450 [Flavobacterium collinsii]|uniref:hypothetical protein n=1 Tax=Flavobacterium collinsii TaxID=1114861 RepID=UPI0022C53C3A|nr:hypothetical protein [Flavobacterium collinsii]GIQ61310.1 hypothetical protein Flavo103_44450 [Flavobacterium collinsii]
MNKINISGIYIYRSLRNDQNVNTNFDDLEFGRGTMDLTQQDNIVKGIFDTGGGYKMTMEGTVESDDIHSYLRMTGYDLHGTVTDKWIYDYHGMIVPSWSNAVKQIPAITGSVIRTVDHGSSKAGVTTTFYMVQGV